MTKTIKELLDEYKKLAVLVHHAEEDDFKDFWAEGEARMEEIISQVEALVRGEVLEGVEREVKEYVKGLDSLPWDEQVDEDVSKMLNNLRVK